MASDLDRPYVINGDDLRIALSRLRIVIEEPEVSNSVRGGPDGWVPLSATCAPKYPEEIARAVLADAATPLEEEERAQAPGVTIGELTRALANLPLTVVNTNGLSNLAGTFRAGTLVTRATGAVMFPDQIAANLMERIDADRRRRAVEEAQRRAEGARCDREGGPCTCPCLPGDDEATRVGGEAGAARSHCPSCSRGDDGGSYPCDCPAACGGRYCQHPLPGPRQVHPGSALAEAVERCRAALSWLSPENRQRAVSTLVADVIKDGKPTVLAEPPGRPIELHMADLELSAIGCIIAVFDDLDGDAASRVLAYITARFGTGA